MAISKDTRIRVEAELSIGRTPVELSKEYPEASYQTILGWKRKQDLAKSQGDTIIDLVKVDEKTLVTIADEIKAKAPADVGKKIDALVDGVVGLQKLEDKFHSLVLSLLTSAETFSKDENLTVRDWKTLGDGIANLYTSIFNKAGVNVNVMNQNNINGEKLSMFKNSMGG